ncbi:thiamine diphosphokinase [Lactococcus nasutitermitis]|uniref:Thiamine diphosphokinase n=1 Tax=Lactococcus nasutitermitis TaxID=1652957 RepID=A0ABV9JBS7_9LACT|nr:thiamine diphosphokinase [Lactococcus nasutitermitis]
MRVLIVAGMPAFLAGMTFDKTIGVDRGNVILLENRLPVDVAVGDFDSISSIEFDKVKRIAKELIKLPAEKDDTDLEVALDYAIQHYPGAEITIAGALGGRLDHMLTNIYLPLTEKYSEYSERISLVDNKNIMRYLRAGKHILPRIADKKYIGFMQVGTEDTLAIENAKYPLKAEDNFKEIYASNEFIDENMTVSFTKGNVIVIYSGD